MSKTSAPKRNLRKGLHSIQIDAEASAMLGRIQPLVGRFSKAELARLAIEWGIGKLESGEMVILNGKLVPNPERQPAAA